MKAIRILKFGPTDVMLSTDVERPTPGAGQVLVRIKAAGVGPWDALVREGKSGLPQKLPLTPGSDLAGTVEAIGTGVTGLSVGEAIYGMTDESFTGAYAEFALASANMLARKPESLSFIEAAGAPVVAVTAWQMLFEYARIKAGHTVLINGGAGNVGGYAVQMARDAGANVIATARTEDLDFVKSLGAQTVVDYHKEELENSISLVDVVIDTVGGETRERSLRILKPGGILVTVVTPPPVKTGSMIQAKSGTGLSQALTFL